MLQHIARLFLSRTEVMHNVVIGLVINKVEFGCDISFYSKSGEVGWIRWGWT